MLENFWVNVDFLKTREYSHNTNLDFFRSFMDPLDNLDLIIISFYIISR
jgi:hypothetical protein